MLKNICKKDLRFIKNHLIPNILKSLLSYIETEQNRIELVAAFAKELKWIKKIIFYHCGITALYGYINIIKLCINACKKCG